MSNALKNDLARFFRVYEEEVADVLQKTVPPATRPITERALRKEFELFKASLLNRINEELR